MTNEGGEYVEFFAERDFLPEDTIPGLENVKDNDEWHNKIEAYTDNKEKTWINGIPEQYRDAAEIWSGQQGVMKIVPQYRKRGFTHTEVADIAEGFSEPQTQIFPISDVQVHPHQISFDFFDTTEGKIGVSNATEKHMQVECDIYVTELVYYYWNHGGKSNDYNGLNYMKYLNNFFDSLGDTWDARALEKLYGFEDTTEFIKFRTGFMMQFSGWVCRFVSHTFSTFNGVITEINYDISSGEQFAKWHLKIEEAIFTEDYSETGQKADTSAGNQDNTNTETTGDKNANK